MKPDREVLRQTGRIAAGVAALVALMIAVFAILGRFTLGVLLGGVYTGALSVANFFLMGLTVQGIANRAAEEVRDEQEMAAFSKQMENRMRLSRNGRMIALFALIVAGIRLFGFDALATILPIAFPTAVIYALQFIDNKRNAVPKGSEKS